MIRVLRIALLLSLSLVVPASAQSPEARIAVAANFGKLAQRLAGDYEALSGHHLDISLGSTGKLYAQIRQGAPFDVFLAADRTTPQRLLDEGLAVADSLHDYAIGRLVLLSGHEGIGRADEQLLRERNFRTFAIANPRLAPYGVAAREVLAHVNRLAELESRFVLGENIAQATQYITTGNADAGLVPWSLALELPTTSSTSWWLIPADWHAPIVQSAVLLKRAENNAAARGFLAYLQSADALRIITSHGYDQP